MAPGQTSVDLVPAIGVPGEIADAGNHDIVSRINPAVAQVSTVTIASVDDSTDYVTTINGVPLSFTSDASATEAEINVGVLAAINDSNFNGVGLAFDVTAVQGATTATVVITADVTDTVFTITVTAVQLTVALTTAAAGVIPFGLGVAQSSTANDQAHLPVASGETVIGISVLDQSIPIDDNDVHQYTAGSVLGIMRQGRIWVIPEDNVTIGGSVYIRHTASANGTQFGAVRSDVDGATAAQLTQATFATTATGGNPAVVVINQP